MLLIRTFFVFVSSRAGSPLLVYCTEACISSVCVLLCLSLRLSRDRL